jgi:hypothetical protein
MFPTFAKVPGLVRVNRLLQVLLARSRVFECIFTLRYFMLQTAWKDESRYISRIFDWLFDIWYRLFAAAPALRCDR